MENNEKRENRSKRTAIIALILALLACSFGFAAYSKSIDIIEERREQYVVMKGGVLSINPDKPQNGKVYPTSTGGAIAEVATLTENGIINIKVTFTAQGQSATYSFFGVNPTKYLTYLNDVVFGDKTCNPGSGTSMEYATVACENIVMYISAKDDSFEETTLDIDDHSIPAESNEPLAVTIKYLPGGQMADGSFSVDFGISNLTYSDID